MTLTIKGAISKLTFIKKKYNFLERFHKVHVFVAKLLNLQNESKLCTICCCESLEELSMNTQVSQGLFSH